MTDRLDVLTRMWTMPMQKLSGLRYVDDEPFLRGEATRIYETRERRGETMTREVKMDYVVYAYNAEGVAIATSWRETREQCDVLVDQFEASGAAESVWIRGINNTDVRLKRENGVFVRA